MTTSFNPVTTSPNPTINTLSVSSTPYFPKAIRQRWAERMRQIQLENIAELTRRGENRLAEQLFKCLVLDEATQDIDLARYYRNKKPCGSRYCVFCGRKEGRKKARRKMVTTLPFIQSGWNMSLFTLTTPNIPTLSKEELDNIFERFKLFMECPILKDAIDGSIACADLTYNPNRDDFHLHLHIVAIHRNSLPPIKQISSEWREKTADLHWQEARDYPGESPSIIRVKEVALDREDSTAVEKALTRVVSYVCKPVKLRNSDAFFRYYQAAYRKRLIRTYGALNGGSKKAVSLLDKGGHNSETQWQRKTTHAQDSVMKEQNERVTTRVDVEARAADAVLEAFKPGEKTFILAENARLKYKANEIKREKERVAQARRTMGMRSGADCPICTGVMPPGRDLCKKCEALEKSINQQQQARKVINT
jgi:hypothetical protein